MAANTPICDFGWSPVDFTLPGTDGKSYRLSDIAGPKGTLVMFICNHCPYVQAVIDRITRDAADLAALGVTTIAISSNDPTAYPDDSFDNMKRFASAHHFAFPYVFDQDQSVARAWGAVCTPDFFGFGATTGLQYRGRLDASGIRPAPPSAKRELFEAMRTIAETGIGPQDQTPSIGCSIKWKSQ